MNKGISEEINHMQENIAICLRSITISKSRASQSSVASMGLAGFEPAATRL